MIYNYKKKFKIMFIIHFHNCKGLETNAIIGNNYENYFFQDDYQWLRSKKLSYFKILGNLIFTFI